MRFAVGETDNKEFEITQILLRDETYQQKSDAYHEALEALKQTLNADQEEALKKLTDETDTFLKTVGQLMNDRGFRAGLRLGIDLFKK